MLFSVYLFLFTFKIDKNILQYAKIYVNYISYAIVNKMRICASDPKCICICRNVDEYCKWLNLQYSSTFSNGVIITKYGYFLKEHLSLYWKYVLNNIVTNCVAWLYN